MARNKGTPSFRGMLQWKSVSKSDVRRHGLGDVRPLLRGEVAGVISVADVWLEQEVETDRRWVAAFRMTTQDGRAVISEVRIFPNESDREPGQWSGEFLGHKAPIPKGGLTTRAIRSASRTGSLTQSLKDLVEATRRTTAANPDAAKHFFDPQDGAFTALGIGELTHPRDPSRRRGRPNLSREDYERCAIAYAHAVDSGSTTPIKDVAKELGLSKKLVQSRVHRARVLGLLEKVRQGSAGGRLLLREKSHHSAERKDHGKASRKR